MEIAPRMWLVEERPADSRTHFGSRFVLTNSNLVRSFWAVVVTLLLFYTGTVFVYRLCFIDFRIHAEANRHAPGPANAAGWASFDSMVAVLFWIDLVINFFFSYVEEDGYEVDDLRLIAKHYLMSPFWINLIACVPDKAIALVVQPYIEESSRSFHQSVGALRLHRISRLFRLTRLTRLARLRQQGHSAWQQWLARTRSFRIVISTIALLLVVHIVACGWYLCAALHDSAEDTWVARRKLVDSEPFDQWVCAVYFTLTVFMTVGFGDISAITVGEMFYACFAMGVGVLVHSVIISEVVNVVVSSDEVQAFVRKQSDLVLAFADHTELDFDVSRRLKRWVDASAKHWVAEKYDRSEMKEILTGKFLPKELLEQLPAALFSGQLLSNNFLWVCRRICNMPPRLPVLVALALSRSTFSAMEVVYRVHDYSCSMFLVASGTFAYVARPSFSGGAAEASAHVSQSDLHLVALKRRQRGSALAKVSNLCFMAKQAVEADELPEMTLFPYALFGRNSYFGDEGLARAAPRTQTARCESECGELLSLSKGDMNVVSHEFPHFGARWAVLARHHERRHLKQLSKLTFGCTYRHLAAVRIQRWLKERSSARPRQERGPHRCREVFEVLTDAADAMRDTSQAGLSALQRDLERLTCTVGGLADKVDKLLSHIEKRVVL